MYYGLLLKMWISLRAVNRGMHSRVWLCYPLRNIKEKTLKLSKICKASVCFLKAKWAQQGNTRQRQSWWRRCAVLHPNQMSTLLSLLMSPLSWYQHQWHMWVFIRGQMGRNLRKKISARKHHLKWDCFNWLTSSFLILHLHIIKDSMERTQ